MRTVKWNPFLSGAAMLLGGVLLWAGAARADYTTTNPASILVFPKVVFDDTTTANTTVDTVIQITNTSPVPVNVRCYLVNAVPSFTPGITTLPPITTTGCVETDFAFTLSPFQPIMWRLSAGTTNDPIAAAALFMNSSAAIPQAPMDPMYGELKCIEVDGSEAPTDGNDLKGEASIETINSSTGAIDINSYNAVGLQALPGRNNKDNTLVLGGSADTAEYAGCPLYLILDNFFDGAEEPIDRDTVMTDLVLVPCSENFLTQTWTKTVVQFLVFNEFEQRFSTSRSSQCYTEMGLSTIDLPNSSSSDQLRLSIFSATVEGTLTGQTLIRGSDTTGKGTHGLLGVAEEFHTGAGRTHTASFSLVQRAPRNGSDIIVLAPTQNQ